MLGKMKCRILCTAACISLVFLQPWTSLAAQTALPISQDEPLRVLIQLPLFASIKKLYGVNLRQTFTSVSYQKYKVLNFLGLYYSKVI